MRKVHELLVELPANTDIVDATALKEFYYLLEMVEHKDVPKFSCDVLASILSLKDHSRTSCFNGGFPEDLPPHLISAVIKAIAYAFPSEKGDELVKSYLYVLGHDRVVRSLQRPKKNDTTVLVALFDVLCPGDGVGQALGMSADQYDLALTGLLIQAFEKRLFQKIEVSQSGHSELSSVLKKYFANGRSVQSPRWSNICKVIKSIHGMVGDEMVFWGPTQNCCLEQVLASEFSFKAFNCHLPEDRIRMLANSIG